MSKVSESIQPFKQAFSSQQWPSSSTFGGQPAFHSVNQSGRQAVGQPMGQSMGHPMGQPMTFSDYNVVHDLGSGMNFEAQQPFQGQQAPVNPPFKGHHQIQFGQQVQHAGAINSFSPQRSVPLMPFQQQQVTAHQQHQGQKGHRAEPQRFGQNQNGGQGTFSFAMHNLPSPIISDFDDDDDFFQDFNAVVTAVENEQNSVDRSV